MINDLMETDNGNILEFTIVDETGNTVDLTDAQLVSFKMKRGNFYVEHDCTITSPAEGKAQLFVDNKISEKSGKYSFQIIVIFKDGSFFNSDIDVISIGNVL